MNEMIKEAEKILKKHYGYKEKTLSGALRKNEYRINTHEGAEFIITKRCMLKIKNNDIQIIREGKRGGFMTSFNLTDECLKNNQNIDSFITLFVSSHEQQNN